ncbi:S1C family serine protease [Microbacterium halophytorum]|uniref:S1C family serine protease n=1 Tax=Microbacterium halophytorum TaxID=2067568 RepID=UPI000CFA9D1D|nr:trypsin-like peptidase domain-containing protein [Microbacterium halophytorum]
MDNMHSNPQPASGAPDEQPQNGAVPPRPEASGPAQQAGAPVPPRPEQPAAEAAAQWSAPAGDPQQAGFLPPQAAVVPPGPVADRSETRPLPPFAHEPAAEASAFGPAAEPVKKKERQRTGGMTVAALLVAAALIGGAAGLGGAYAGNEIWGSDVASTASGNPDTITVNNPGSVNEATAIATEVMPSTVTISASAADGAGSGTGAILSEDGYVLTNTHVVTLGGATSDAAIRVTGSDGTIYDADIVGTDPVYDLAVIKLRDASGLTPIEFADSDELNVGETTVAIGAPLGLPNTVTSGIISALDRSIQIQSSAAPESTDQPKGEGDGEESPFFFDLPGQEEQQTGQESISLSVIQTDAAINPGNSGGPLVNSEGQLIGVNVAIATAGGTSESESGSVGIGFSIPSNVAQRVSQEIIENGEATHGLLGASVTSASAYEQATAEGAVLVEVPDGAAKDAGLERGDIITEFNGKPIHNATDLTAQVRAVAGGSEATLTYVRDGKSNEAEVTLGTL